MIDYPLTSKGLPEIEIKQIQLFGNIQQRKSVDKTRNGYLFQLDEAEGRIL